MNNPFDFFELITCINLDNRPERWSDSQIEFKKVGIKDRVQRFSAIKNEAVPLRGFYESVMGVIEQARDANSSNILSLEDDVAFMPGITENLTTTLEQLPEDWGLFFLGCNITVPAIRYDTHLLKLNQAFATHAIAINHNLYDFILNNAVHSPPLDAWMSDTIITGALKPCYAMYPLGATQRPSYSDIERGHRNYTFIEDRYTNRK